MVIYAHDVLRFVHIVLFALWLGTDLGVYLIAKQVARPELPTDERHRLIALLVKIDMFPRCSLILMLPVGFHLAAGMGLIGLSGWALLLVWLAFLSWFGLMWAVHRTHRDDLRRMDLAVRWLMMAGLLGLGAAGLVSDWPAGANWLSVKLVLFAGVIGIGILLRGSLAVMMEGFDRLTHDPAEGNRLIAEGRREAAFRVHWLWLALVLMAFLGTTKAF